MISMMVSVLIHGAVFVGSPNIVVPPRLSQVSKLIITGVFSVSPFLWSMFLLLFYRTKAERIVGYVSLAASLFWLGYAVSIGIDLARVL